LANACENCIHNCRNNQMKNTKACGQTGKQHFKYHWREYWERAHISEVECRVSKLKTSSEYSISRQAYLFGKNRFLIFPRPF